MLFEKQYMLGGLGTAGIVTKYLPLCDGYGNQVSFGIAEEFLRLSILHGAEDRYPENWLDGKGTRGKKDKRFEVRYSPQLFAILAEKLLMDAGVKILYGTYIPDEEKTKEKHAMRYAPYTGLAQVSNWVRLKFATMNLKKLAKWKWNSNKSASNKYAFF